ncbi:MAG TPA: hypothetical protein PLB63_12445, partial [Planctomycetota bacterium]|nr:hypothetical protein [Planctomycetota bacterium]
MFIPISFRTSFEDVYNITEYTVPEYTGTRLAPTGNNVYIHFCFFEELTSSEEGGAIYCCVQRLLVEQSSFISCKTSDDRGGGIYSSSSQCVLSKICAFKCYSTYSYDSCAEGEEDPYFYCSYYSDGQFAYISASRNITCKNHVNDSSITHTLKDSTDPQYPLYLDDGNILCTSVNLTKNEC